ncbi:unnamed protein product [Candidula unifasciata]|uniref:Hexosyltransferase n=1 Tax=Candidula unifasciata TaxID=100452 RepID=A0A8S3Z682_9EUPU|nr:unnamed protein product [Candidula unifasciata]
MLYYSYFFLLGQPREEDTLQAVLNESRAHQDIVVAEFQDSYRNLTLKTVTCMRWLATRCPDAKYFLKTDDDVWVDVDNLLATLKQFSNQLRTSLGGVCRSVVVIRDTLSKWYASKDEFPADSYEPYCSGTGYVGSLHLAKRVAEIYVKVPYFHLEDVYMGMCLKALGYNTILLPRFDNTAAPNEDNCKIKTGGFVTIHKVPTERMEQIHNSTCIKKKLTRQ